jgi:hypothetical protein
MKYLMDDIIDHSEMQYQVMDKIKNVVLRNQTDRVPWLVDSTLTQNIYAKIYTFRTLYRVEDALREDFDE